MSVDVRFVEPKSLSALVAKEPLHTYKKVKKHE